jgi:hypothetical protein
MKEGSRNAVKFQDIQVNWNANTNLYPFKTRTLVLLLKFVEVLPTASRCTHQAAATIYSRCKKLRWVSADNRKYSKSNALLTFIMLKFNNTHQIYAIHNHFHFIKTQNLDMFWASFAHPQEALHKHSFEGCSVSTLDVGWSQYMGSLPISWDQPTSTTAHNSHQFVVRVVPTEDGQVMSEICRDIEHQ